MKLYEIADGLADLAAYIEESDGGEIDPAIVDRVMAMDSHLSTKVEGICKMILSMERGAESAKAESDRLARLAKSRSSNARGLRDYLTYHLERLGKLRVDTPTLTVTVASRPMKVLVLTSPDTLPDRFQRVPAAPAIEADKAALLRAFEGGERLPDGVVIEQGRSLRIR